MATQRHAYGAYEGPRPAAHEREAALAALASRQYGVVSRAQLVALGFGRQAIQRRLRARRLVRLHRVVYAVGHWALTARARELAAVLACGPRALLSHGAAGARHGLLRSGGQIEVTAARSCKRKAGILVHTSRAIHPDDRDEVDGIPLTSVARTIVDLAGRLGDSAVARVLNEAEVRQLLDVAAVEAALGRVPGARGRPRLVAALANYSEAPGYSESEAERLLRRLCRRHGLPQPGRVFHSGCELDFYWPDAQLAIEVDGHAFHSTRRAFHDDRRRDRLLATKGIQVVRVTWNDLARRPGELALELSDVRARRLT